MAEPLIIIGAGGFGREAHDVVVAINRAASEPVWEFIGFLDDGEVQTDRLERRGTVLLGTTGRLPEYSGASYVVGIGNAEVRRALAARADQTGLRAATLIHPNATMGLDVEVGEGSIICSHVSITTNVRLGRHAHLDQNVTVGHDVTMRDYVRVNPGATISGNVTLHEGATIGTNAAVIQGLKVGAHAFVGAGAVVTKDVSAGSTAIGVPARPRSA